MRSIGSRRSIFFVCTMFVALIFAACGKQSASNRTDPDANAIPRPDSEFRYEAVDLDAPGSQISIAYGLRGVGSMLDYCTVSTTGLVICFTSTGAARTAPTDVPASAYPNFIIAEVWRSSRYQTPAAEYRQLKNLVLREKWYRYESRYFSDPSYGEQQALKVKTTSGEYLLHFDNLVPESLKELTTALSRLMKMAEAQGESKLIGEKDSKRDYPF